MVNEQNGNGMTFRKTAIWLGAISALFMPAACLQIAGIDPPIFDPNVNAGTGGVVGGSESSSSSGMGGAGPCTESELKSCYSGPPGTENVGSCKSGTTICLFGQFQPCTSDTTPTTEDCATEEDEDCDGMAGAQDLECVLSANWVYSQGTPAPPGLDDAAFAITRTKDGGQVIGGIVNAMLGADHTSATSGDGYIAKINASGNKVWEKKLVGSANSYAMVRGVAEDLDGNIVAVGVYNGTISIDMTNMMSVGTDGFIMKMDSTGNTIWRLPISADGIQTINGVTVDSMKNVFIVGSTNGQVDFGGGLSMAPALQDIFVASYGGDKSFHWAKHFVNPGTQVARGIAVIPGMPPEVVIAAATSGATQLDVGGMLLPCKGGQDIVLARYALMDGSHSWSGTFGDNQDQEVHAIAVDSSKDLLLTGNFQGTIDWAGSGTSTCSTAKPSVFAVRVTATGNLVSGIEPGVDGSSVGLGIAEDADGNTIVIGQFDGNLNWNGLPMKVTSGTDSFVVRLDDAGGWMPMGGTVIGDFGDQRAWATATHDNFSFVIAGSYTTEVHVPPFASTTPVGGVDLFAAKFNP